MNTNEIATKEDLTASEKRIIEEIVKFVTCLTKNNPVDAPKFLRTSAARKMLNVSENKLKDMRLKREIPFTFIGGTYYYPEAGILETLNKNMVPSKPKQ